MTSITHLEKKVIGILICCVGIIIVSIACSLSDGLSNLTANQTKIQPTSEPSTCRIEIKMSCDTYSDCQKTKQPKILLIISCESGKYNQSLNTDQSYQVNEGFVTIFEGARTYTNTTHEYKINGSTSLKISNETGLITAKYHFEVTGGIFGEKQQISDSDWMDITPK